MCISIRCMFPVYMYVYMYQLCVCIYVYVYQLYIYVYLIFQFLTCIGFVFPARLLKTGPVFLF